ncbi:MAG: zinc-ribbon domain-containing protein [Oscillospiraceae bacterium]|nr:zinc-ribbon domain-containing protein [Oscillospiraceae bacterium]
MAFCRKCGIEINEEAKFCPACGAPTRDDPFDSAKATAETKFNEINNTEDYTSEYDANDIETNKIISLFAYIGLLILVPIFGAKDSAFAKFHISQGVNLIILELMIGAATGVLTAIFQFSSVLLTLVSIASAFAELAVVALLIIGIVNCVNGRAKELPFIGSWKIVK